MVFTLTALTKAELDEIVLALNERPYKSAAPLLSKLAEQVNAQLVAMNPPQAKRRKKSEGPE